MSRKNTYIQRWLWLDILFILGIAYFIFSLWNFANTSPDSPLARQWQWESLAHYFTWKDEEGWHAGLFVKGVLATLKLGIWAGLVACITGLAMGMYLAVTTKGPIYRLLYAILIFLRNTPPLVLLFLLYFIASENMLTFLGEIIRYTPESVQSAVAFFFAPPETMDRMLAAVVTLGLYQGAYVAEIVRAGLQSLPQGQWDAAAALGFPRLQQFTKVLLPQALPIMLPPLAGQYVSIFKDSALAALISVPELTFQGMEIVAITRLPFEAWTIILLLYLAISLLCTRCFAYVESRLKWVQKR